MTIIALERLGTVSDLLEQHAKEFEEENPDIKIKVQAYPGSEYWQKVEVRAAAETLGDTLFNSLTHDWFGMCDRGLYLAIDPHLEAEGVDLHDEFYDFAVDEAMMWQGKTYGISEFSHPGLVGVYINKSLYDEVGITYPNWEITFDGLMENAIALTKDKNGDGRLDQWGWQMPGGHQWFPYFYSYGGYWFSEDGTKAIVDSEENMKALQWVYDMGYKHKAAVTAELIQENTTFMFSSGMMGAMHGYYGTKFSLDKSVGDKFEWMATPFPYNPGTDDKVNRRAHIHTGPQGIYVSTKHPEEAYRWLRYLTGYDASMIRARANFTLTPRPDVWEAPELMALEHHQMFIKYYQSDNAHILRTPANLRVLELINMLKAALSPIATGKQTPEEAISDIQSALQTALDKPKP